MFFHHCSLGGCQRNRVQASQVAWFTVQPGTFLYDQSRLSLKLIFILFATSEAAHSVKCKAGKPPPYRVSVYYPRCRLELRDACQGCRSLADCPLPSILVGNDWCSCTIIHRPDLRSRPTVVRTQTSVSDPSVLRPDMCISPWAS